MRLNGHIILTHIVYLGIFLFSGLIVPDPAAACDDTLLALMTANDPNSEFSQGIREFNRSLAELGSALKADKPDDLDGKLEKVMESWLAFSNRFNVNPPEVARLDVAWPAKMRETAERVGRIRKLMQEGKHLPAHDEILSLSGRLGMFFEAVGMTDLKRRFLACSEILTRLEQDRLAGRLSGVRASCASLTAWLVDFRPKLASDAIPPFERSLQAAAELDAVLAGTENASPSARVEELAKQIDANVLDLRARVLMREWFPPAPDRASGTEQPQK
ncbi:MAG TPA: hypothetical protein VIV61_15555 [Candidatus Ozemobacteraceae bacterium]